MVARYGPGPDAHCPLPCKWCDAPLADPYLEQDAVLIFMDLVLHKPAAYRHLLHNNLDSSSSGDGCDVTMWLTGRLFGLLVWFWWYAGKKEEIVGMAVFAVVSYCTASVLFQRRPKLSTFLMAIQLAQFGRLLVPLSVIFRYHYSGPVDDWLVRIFCFTSTVEAVMAVCHYKPLPGHPHPVPSHRLPMAYLFAHVAVMIGSFCQYKVVTRIGPIIGGIAK